MHIKTRNINTGFREIVSGIHNGEIKVDEQSSRNGTVLVINEPVIISYSHPRERVLFNNARDINPFSLLYEALWMLAGRNDVAPLTYYTKQFQEYSDDGNTLSGAYGYRWRHSIPGGVDLLNDKLGYHHLQTDNMSADCIDQLTVLIDHLKKNPSSRRAVLNMWNCEDDLLKIDSSRDICCNLNICFSIRNEYRCGCGAECFSYETKYLDMTVFNRSNDLIWGTLAANFVTFYLLQEYMACCLGLEVGTYNQVSNNLHVYTETNSGWKPEEWLEEYKPRCVCSKCTETSLTGREYVSHGVCSSCGIASSNLRQQFYESPYPEALSTIQLVQDQATFDKEVQEFVELNKNGEEITQYTTWTEPFLRDVAQPMCHAFHLHKGRDYEASLHWASLVKAGDWRLASMNWIKKRQLNWEKKHANSRTED